MDSQVTEAKDLHFFSYLTFRILCLLSISLIVICRGHLNWVSFMMLEQMMSHSNWTDPWLEEPSHCLGSKYPEVPVSSLVSLVACKPFSGMGNWLLMVLLTFLFTLSAYPSLVWFSPLCIICERVSHRSHTAEELKHKIQLKTFSVLFRYRLHLLFLSVCLSWFNPS